MSDYDVVFVGGGAGGLSAALTLARARRRSVLVVDAGQPRNASAAHVHGYLGREMWRRPSCLQPGAPR